MMYVIEIVATYRTIGNDVLSTESNSRQPRNFRYANRQFSLCSIAIGVQNLVYVNCSITIQPIKGMHPSS
jgi:hypothetical protein